MTTKGTDMITPTSTVTDPYAAINGSGARTSTPLSDANASQDRFLKLLVAQLNNQDPLNPMDNAQMTSQMAQINTVSGISQLNETMKSMASQFGAFQSMQAATMIGREVLLGGNTLPITSGVAKGAFDLAGDANKVSIQVTTPGGQLIEEINLGQKTAGRHDFQWDAAKYTGSNDAIFKVVATNQGRSVPAASLARATVVGVGTNGADVTLQLKGRDPVSYSAIQAIL